MFDKLMGGPLVELIERIDNTLVYRCKKQPARGGEMSIRVAGRSGATVRLWVKIEHVRTLPAGGYLCVANSNNSEVSTLVPPLTNGAGLRCAERFNHRMPLICSALAATTVDFSVGGLQVATSQRLQPGQVFNLKLAKGLDCKVRVAWFSEASRPFRAGLEFYQLDAATKVLLGRYERSLKAGKPFESDGQTVPSAISPTQARLAALAAPSYADLPSRLDGR
ncbi:MAG: PilZ domain-containing protein [Vulcanimicrobiota bacterium]